MDVDDIDPPNTPKEDNIPISSNVSMSKVVEKLTPIKNKNNDKIELKKFEEVDKNISPIIQFTPKIKSKVENKPVHTKADIKKELNYNNALWTSKYNPKTTNDIIGNQSQVNKIVDWLNNWNDVVLKGHLRELPNESRNI
jgi:hypothetical protein